MSNRRDGIGIGGRGEEEWNRHGGGGGTQFIDLKTSEGGVREERDSGLGNSECRGRGSGPPDQQELVLERGTPVSASNGLD